MTENIEELLKKSRQLEKVVSVLSDKLNSYEKNSLNLTIESIRFSSEYKQIDKKYHEAFKALQMFNKSLTKKQKQEMSQLRRKRMMLKTNNKQ